MGKAWLRGEKAGFIPLLIPMFGTAPLRSLWTVLFLFSNDLAVYCFKFFRPISRDYKGRSLCMGEC